MESLCAGGDAKYRHAGRYLHYGLWLLWLWTCPAGSDERVRWQQPAEILRSFHEIALRTEYGPDAKVLQKWTSPVNIWLDHRVGDADKHAMLVRMHIEHLAAITGHPLRLVNSPAEANMKLIFSRNDQFFRDARNEMGVQAAGIVRSSTCICSLKSVQGSLVKATIIIPVDRARAQRKLVACIVEEITQAMGLPNDSDSVYPSIFNDRSTDQLLSGLDYLLLRILYDPRMHAGMPPGAAMALAQTIIGEMQVQGTIGAAARLARSGALYRLLGL
ncbi:MAG: DUF2927 domain-containing protein [Methylococcaceae bacterium]|nr:MAG: DUF2927 domain-containing protein [Methylococcaceae bacterium]